MKKKITIFYVRSNVLFLYFVTYYQKLELTVRRIDFRQIAVAFEMFLVKEDVMYENRFNCASIFSMIPFNLSNIISVHRSRLNIENNVDSVIAKHTSKDSRRISLVLFITPNRTVSGPILIESIRISSRFQRQF